MAVHDYILSNQSGSSFRSDLNNALAAIVSQNSSATEPATKYAFQYWIDTSATPALIKQRNAANDAWITLAEVDGQVLAADGTDAKPGISFAADIDTGFRRTTSNEISIVTGGEKALTVDGSQNVGIGTTDPTQLLQVAGPAISSTFSGTTISAGTTERVRIGFRTGGPETSLTCGQIVNDTNTLHIAARDTTNGDIVLHAGSGAPERMRIDGSNGHVGIGVTSPEALLHLASDEGGSTGRIKFDCNVTSGYDSLIETTDVGLEFTAKSSSRGFAFKTGSTPSEKLRIASNGNVGVGTNNPLALFEVSGAAQVNTLFRSTGNSSSSIRFINTSNSDVYCGSNEGDFRILTDGLQRMRVTSEGHALFHYFNSVTPGFGNTDTGGSIHKSSNGTTLFLSRDNISGNFNRNSNGDIIQFRKNGVEQGDIRVSGSTVTYAGGHLSRFAQLEGNGDRIEILRGSVLSNLDEMCVWDYDARDAELWEEGDEIPEGASVGDVKVPAREAGTELNEQLNRLKVSDVEGDPNVAGVFEDWDDDDEVYTKDFFCAMTGDFVIRIAQGTTVARGDLLMSAGDGTAKPQDDDIVRSKTVAKVTSTVVSETYADGSYCVPCVLMAC
mgnify:CR=1 FL=1|jgi:hypothetical protein|tara:strand:+ start:1246 stop:3084 length:1839 start_codon:yes stop_codon:yes gene_type:complete